MKRMLILFLIVVLMFCASNSFSQVINGNYNDASGSVSTASTLALAYNPTRGYLFIQNVSATNSLGFTIGSKNAVINGYGTIILAAGQGILWTSKVPTGEIDVIGSGSGTVYTIKWM